MSDWTNPAEAPPIATIAPHLHELMAAMKAVIDDADRAAYRARLMSIKVASVLSLAVGHEIKMPDPQTFTVQITVPLSHMQRLERAISYLQGERWAVGLDEAHNEVFLAGLDAVVDRFASAVDTKTEETGCAAAK